MLNTKNVRLLLDSKLKVADNFRSFDPYLTSFVLHEIIDNLYSVLPRKYMNEARGNNYRVENVQVEYNTILPFFL
jgi:hypothetical protein